MALAIKAGECHPKQFAQPMAASGSPQQRLDFVNALHPSAAAGGKRSFDQPKRARHCHGDGRVDPPDTNNARVKFLGREGMDAVVQASLATRDASSVTSFESRDSGLLQRLASAMARSGNAREQSEPSDTDRDGNRQDRRHRKRDAAHDQRKPIERLGSAERSCPCGSGLRHRHRSRGDRAAAAAWQRPGNRSDGAYWGDAGSSIRRATDVRLCSGQGRLARTGGRPR